ncbi:chorismate-pyruvate lyase [Kaistia hirudinis]|uniref:Chorismate-pyruvate lyase n=1 Tax=Kaistia hirudinis TaxID=1293440 RepID=A0A840AKN6_9HYPH|nr:hypothetical protein [Kaistia hirudinis]MBB3929928.1 chorismate-pyruvate lyase [Kaistia hirudinis]
MRRAILIAGLAGMLTAGSSGDAFGRDVANPIWPDNYVGRLQALALVQSLRAELLANPSATLVLDRWCADHRLAPPGSKIVADRVKGTDKAADAAVREALGVGPDEPIAYRRVRLTCGDTVLSEADNWYVPALLTEAMNRELETTDTSFGRVVKPLDFTRTTIASKLLWSPLPEGWEMQAADGAAAANAALPVPDFVLQNRAVLKRADGRPFSLVVENYTGNILAFPPPAR